MTFTAATHTQLPATLRHPDPGAFARKIAGGEAIGLYLHIPFCEKKCPYCDFNTYAGLSDLFDATVDALCAEMARWSDPLRDRTVATIFLGGGTPTVLDAAQLERLFSALHANFRVAADAEITSEANPGTVDRAKFQTLRALGVNRLSLGVQSLDPEELAFLGRIHGVEDVCQAVESARAAGFDNLNLDFIFGLPRQDPERFSRTLDKALALQPDHLSLYSLIVEENTPLFQWVEDGRVEAPDNDLAADLYEMAMNRLAAAGFAHYEVSNWARRLPGETAESTLPLGASRHNLLYWFNGEYLGIGPGAHSHLRSATQMHPGTEICPGTEIRPGTEMHSNTGAGLRSSRRWGNRKPVAGYVRRIQRGESVEAFAEEPDARTAMGETMMVGLRLVRHGVADEHFQALHNQPLHTAFGNEIAALAAQGLLTVDPERVCLTERGLLVGNQVFAHFLPDAEAPDSRPAPKPAHQSASHVMVDAQVEI